MKKHLRSMVTLIVIILFIVTGIAVSHHPKPHRAQHPKNITVSQFVKQIAPAAQRDQKKYHIPASITIAQAGLESDWGRSRLAYKYNNLFGIKANSKHNRVKMTTTEHIHGKDHHIKQYFQVYDSWSDSINDHTKLIIHGTADNPHRFKAVQKAKSYQQAARALQENGYATDSNYANKLIYAIKKFHLAKYDHY